MLTVVSGDRPKDPAVDPDREYFHKGKAKRGNPYKASAGNVFRNKLPAPPKSKVEMTFGKVSLTPTLRGLTSKGKSLATTVPPSAAARQAAVPKATQETTRSAVAPVRRTAFNLINSPGAFMAAWQKQQDELKQQPKAMQQPEQPTPQDPEPSPAPPHLTTTSADALPMWVDSVVTVRLPQEAEQLPKPIDTSNIRKVPVQEFSFPAPVNAAAQADETWTDGQRSPAALSGFSPDLGNLRADGRKSSVPTTELVGLGISGVDFGPVSKPVTASSHIADLMDIDIPEAEKSSLSPTPVIVSTRCGKSSDSMPTFVMYNGHKYELADKIDDEGIRLETGYSIGAEALGGTILGERNHPKPNTATQTTPSLAESKFAPTNVEVVEDQTKSPTVSITSDGTLRDWSVPQGDVVTSTRVRKSAGPRAVAIAATASAFTSTTPTPATSEPTIIGDDKLLRRPSVSENSSLLESRFARKAVRAARPRAKNPFDPRSADQITQGVGMPSTPTPVAQQPVQPPAASLDELLVRAARSSPAGLPGVWDQSAAGPSTLKPFSTDGGGQTEVKKPAIESKWSNNSKWAPVPLTKPSVQSMWAPAPETKLAIDSTSTKARVESKWAPRAALSKSAPSVQSKGIKRTKAGAGFEWLAEKMAAEGDSRVPPAHAADPDEVQYPAFLAAAAPAPPPAQVPAQAIASTLPVAQEIIASAPRSSFAAQGSIQRDSSPTRANDQETKEALIAAARIALRFEAQRLAVHYDSSDSEL